VNAVAMISLIEKHLRKCCNRLSASTKSDEKGDYADDKAHNILK